MYFSTLLNQTKSWLSYNHIPITTKVLNECNWHKDYSHRSKISTFNSTVLPSSQVSCCWNVCYFVVLTYEGKSGALAWQMFSFLKLDIRFIWIKVLAKVGCSSFKYNEYNHCGTLCNSSWQLCYTHTIILYNNHTYKHMPRINEQTYKTKQNDLHMVKFSMLRCKFWEN